MQQAVRPPLGVIIIYAIGQLGWSLASFGVANLIVYFYMPPEPGQEAIFPVFIQQGAIFGVIAVIGLINFGGRLFDGITDPLIANWSDRKQSTFGKRKFFMAWAAVPFALLSFLIFYPLSSSAITFNTWWLVAMVFLLFLFMTLYVVPYTALISELGHHPSDRLLISTLISVTWALGFIIGQSIFVVQSIFEASMGSVKAFQMGVGIFAVVALICMFIPVFFLNEKKYCYQQNQHHPLSTSLRTVFSNLNFRYFIFSDLMYWLALTFIQLGVSYYVTVLFGLDKGFATLFATIGFLGSFLLYIPINIIAKRWGKKILINAAFLVFCLIFILTYFTPQLPMNKEVLFYLLAILSAYPLATFGILPNTIIADMVYESEAATGQQLSGMFYATRNFMMKLGISMAGLIFPSLLQLGKSSAQNLGIRLTALFAVVCCVIGFLLFLKYREKAK